MRRHGSSLMGFRVTDRVSHGRYYKILTKYADFDIFGNISSYTSISDIFYIYFIISFIFNPFLTSSGNI